MENEFSIPSDTTLFSLAKSTSPLLMLVEPLPARDMISHIPGEILVLIATHLKELDLRNLSLLNRRFRLFWYKPRAPKEIFYHFPWQFLRNDPGDWAFSLHATISKTPSWKQNAKSFAFLCPHRTQRVDRLNVLPGNTLKFCCGKRQVHSCSSPIKEYYIIEQCHEQCAAWIQHEIYLPTPRQVSSAPAIHSWIWYTRITPMAIVLPAIRYPGLFQPGYLRTNPTVLNTLVRNLQALSHIPICPHMGMSSKDVVEAMSFHSIIDHDGKDPSHALSGQGVIECSACEDKTLSKSMICWWSCEIRAATFSTPMPRLCFHLNIHRSIGMFQKSEPWFTWNAISSITNSPRPPWVMARKDTPELVHKISPPYNAPPWLAWLLNDTGNQDDRKPTPEKIDHISRLMSEACHTPRLADIQTKRWSLPHLQNPRAGFQYSVF